MTPTFKEFVYRGNRSSRHQPSARQCQQVQVVETDDFLSQAQLREHLNASRNRPSIEPSEDNSPSRHLLLQMSIEESFAWSKEGSPRLSSRRNA